MDKDCMQPTSQFCVNCKISPIIENYIRWKKIFLVSNVLLKIYTRWTKLVWPNWFKYKSFCFAGNPNNKNTIPMHYQWGKSKRFIKVLVDIINYYIKDIMLPKNIKVYIMCSGYINFLFNMSFKLNWVGVSLTWPCWLSKFFLKKWKAKRQTR